jgi:hypothetical protein
MRKLLALALLALALAAETGLMASAAGDNTTPVLCPGF